MGNIIKFPLVDGKPSLKMDEMNLAEQEKIWKLSRENTVLYQDVNGIWWQVLDCTEGKRNEQKSCV